MTFFGGQLGSDLIFGFKDFNAEMSDISGKGKPFILSRGPLKIGGLRKLPHLPIIHQYCHTFQCSTETAVSTEKRCAKANITLAEHFAILILFSLSIYCPHLVPNFLPMP